jgi:large repetitive protein
VTATDAAGNSSSTTVTWTRDTTPPPAPVVSPPASTSSSRSPSFTVTDTEVGVGFACSVSGPSAVNVSTCGATTTLDLTGAADGTYSLTVIALDPAGNPSTSTTVSFVLDTAAPPAPDVSAPPALTNSLNVTLTMSDTEPGVVLTCLLTAPNGAVVRSGACPASGVFDTTGFGDGVYTLVVTATDAAGNRSSTTVSWTRDTTPPPAPTVSAPASPTNATRVTLSIGDAEPSVVLTCALTAPDGSVVASGPCPANGSFNTNPYGDGV